KGGAHNVWERGWGGEDWGGDGAVGGESAVDGESVVASVGAVGGQRAVEGAVVDWEWWSVDDWWHSLFWCSDWGLWTRDLWCLDWRLGSLGFKWSLWCSWHD